MNNVANWSPNLNVEDSDGKYMGWVLRNRLGEIIAVAPTMGVCDSEIVEVLADRGYDVGRVLPA